MCWNLRHRCSSDVVQRLIVLSGFLHVEISGPPCCAEREICQVVVRSALRAQTHYNGKVTRYMQI